MKTLIANRYAGNTKTLARMGRGNIAEMSKYFRNNTEMGEAIGVTDSAVSNWFMLKNMPNKKADLAAAAWLARNRPEPVAEPEPQVDMFQPPAVETDGMYLVSIPKDVEKVKRVLAMFGCEIVEI